MDRAGLVRRNTVLLALAQGFVQMSFPVLLVVGGVAAGELSGRDGASGLLWAVYFVAAAGGALVIGRWMDRVGRKPGLLLAYALVAAAGLGCGLSIRAGSFMGLLLSTIPFGLAVGGANLARGAVADMYPPEARGKAVGVLLAAGTVGAVGSPLLVVLLKRLAEGAGADPNVLPWIVVPVGALGAAACLVAVRPDPRDLAVAAPSAPSGPPRAPRALLASRSIRTAVLAAAVGQMAMVGVMGVTPTALHHLGHGGGAISWAISIHIAGMFAFSPLIGAALDRFGRRAGLIAGCVASIAGALVAATELSAAVVGAGLFAIGLGWSATFLGATAVISDATSAGERAGALGFTDLFVSLSSATAGLASGALLEVAGYRTLGVVVAAIVGVALLAVTRLREAVPVPAEF